MRVVRCVAAFALGAVSGLVVAAPAVAAPSGSGLRAGQPPAEACRELAKTGKDFHDVPYAQHMLAPQRAWTQSRGRGVLVGVIDSGIDTNNPAVSREGKVLQGYDFIRDKPGAQFDCISHGTAVASIIAGDQRTGFGFHGVAPDARLLPIRVSDDEKTPQNGSQQGDAVDPTVFADAIRYAVDQGATVLNLSVVLYSDQAPVRDAIKYALAKDAVVVAAVGNEHDQQQETPETPDQPDPTPYPAAYPGVLGVGSIQHDGTRAVSSQVGSYVRLVAPGEDVLAATRVKGMLFFKGTSFATPFVSGTAALVRAAHPELTGAEVTKRILATTDAAPGGPSGPEYGVGVVDPFRAVTEELGGANATTAPKQVQTVAPDVAAARRTAAAHQRAAHANDSVQTLAIVAVIGGLLVGVIVLGTRRRWTPSRVDTPDTSVY